MKNMGLWLAQRGRGLARLVGAVAAVALAYAWALAGHNQALALVSLARQQIARSDWTAAVESIDLAVHADRYVSFEAYLLRGTAINRVISETGALPAGHARRDGLADIDRYLQSAPDSGEAHYQRGCALAGLVELSEARAAFARAIPLLVDPTDALVEHAGLSFHDFDYLTSEKMISLAIERRPLVPEYYEQRALYRRCLRDFHGAYLDNSRAVKLHEKPVAASLEEVESNEHDPGNQPVTARQDSPDVRAALAVLDGEWVVFFREPDRRTADNPAPESLIFQFHDGELTMIRDGQHDPYGSYRIEPENALQRVRIDLSRPFEGRESTMRGLYDIQDDVLRLCVADEGGPRPRAFTTKGLFGVMVYTMKRVRK